MSQTNQSRAGGQKSERIQNNEARLPLRKLDVSENSGNGGRINSVFTDYEVARMQGAKCVCLPTKASSTKGIHF